jgi:hypothetical protein
LLRQIIAGENQGAARARIRTQWPDTGCHWAFRGGSPAPSHQRQEKTLISSQHKQHWRSLYWEWAAANKVADFLDQQLLASLRLCLEVKSTPPPQRVLDELARARGAATASRIKLDLFVEKLFLGLGYR